MVMIPYDYDDKVIVEYVVIDVKVGAGYPH